MKRNQKFSTPYSKNNSPDTAPSALSRRRFFGEAGTATAAIAAAHPSYPTGHGMVAGACITILKFSYDGTYVIPDPMVSSSDGLSLLPSTGSDADQIAVNAELNKLARNASFGHGVGAVGAGIH